MVTSVIKPPCKWGHPVTVLSDLYNNIIYKSRVMNKVVSAILDTDLENDHYTRLLCVHDTYVAM